MHSQHEIEKKKYVRVFYSSINISCVTVLNFPLKVVVDFFAETTENTSMLGHVFLRAFAIMQSFFFFFFFISRRR